MSTETSALFDLLSWLWENAASVIWQTFVMWLLARLLLKGRQLLTKPTKPDLAPTQRSGSKVGRLRRKLKLTELRFLRRYRFDTAWIGREVSRGHTCQLIFLLWFGLWLMAAGLKDIFVISHEPFGKSPVVMVLTASPMYVFELLWIYYSGRSERIIQHRQKIKAWRFWR